MRTRKINVHAIQCLTPAPLEEGEYQAMVSHLKKLLITIPPLKGNPPLVGIGGTITALSPLNWG
jgi:hypothetical protein